MTWMSSRVEACSLGALQFGFGVWRGRARARVRERKRVASVSGRVAICKVMDGVVSSEMWLDGYL